MKESIYTDKAPAPIGPYSQGIAAQGKLIFVSGQIPFTPDGKLVGDDIQSQTKQAIENVIAVLAAANAKVDDAVKVTILMKDMNDFATVNEIYGKYFSESKPARAAFEVARLPKDVLIEIEAIAVV